MARDLDIWDRSHEPDRDIARLRKNLLNFLQIGPRADKCPLNLQTPGGDRLQGCQNVNCVPRYLAHRGEPTDLQHSHSWHVRCRSVGGDEPRQVDIVIEERQLVARYPVGFDVVVEHGLRSSDEPVAAGHDQLENRVVDGPLEGLLATIKIVYGPAMPEDGADADDAT